MFASSSLHKLLFFFLPFGSDMQRKKNLTLIYSITFYSVIPNTRLDFTFLHSDPVRDAPTNSHRDRFV